VDHHMVDEIVIKTFLFDRRDSAEWTCLRGNGIGVDIRLKPECFCDIFASTSKSRKPIPEGR